MICSIDVSWIHGTSSAPAIQENMIFMEQKRWRCDLFCCATIMAINQNRPITPNDVTPLGLNLHFLPFFLATNIVIISL